VTPRTAAVVAAARRAAPAVAHPAPHASAVPASTVTLPAVAAKPEPEPAAAPAAPAAPAPSPLVALAAAQVALDAGKPAPAWLRKDTKAPKPALATKDGPSPYRIGSMLFLVALLGGIAYYAKKRKQGAPAAQVNQQLRVLGSTRIGAKATAVVVEIAGKRILLGVTEQSVSNLAWLDDEANQAVEEREVSATHTAAAHVTRPSAAPEAASPSGFLKLLRNAVGSGAAQKVVPSDEIARATRDEVRLSHKNPSPRRERAVPPRETDDDALLEGQVMGLMKRRKESP